MNQDSYRRYTELPSLIHILSHRALTLLDPTSWDDKNDSYFIAQYKEKRRLKSVLALCFTNAPETYHHWRIFAPGSAGVCIQFKPTALVDLNLTLPGLRFERVDYLTIEQLRTNGIGVSKLPFSKRYAFEPENELRLLWESEKEQRKTLPVPIDLSAISRITLSPWINGPLAEEVKSVLRSIDGCSNLKISRSTLISNADWMRHGASAK